MNTPQLREQCASQLLAGANRLSQMSAFVGLDGFVDEILHVVDKRESAEKYMRLPTIKQFAERLDAAAGRSTNVELVSQLTKLGGNGPIMANALATFGLKVTYLGKHQGQVWPRQVCRQIRRRRPRGLRQLDHVDFHERHLVLGHERNLPQP